MAEGVCLSPVHFSQLLLDALDLLLITIIRVVRELGMNSDLKQMKFTSFT